ncbi:MAG: CAP domain-containing protein [Haloferacaceae archaeon]
MATHFRKFAALVLVAFVGLGVASLFGYEVGVNLEPEDSPIGTPGGNVTATPTPSAEERARWRGIRKPDVRTAFRERLNRLRENRSRLRLRPDRRLRRVATAHSEDMAVEGYLNTTEPDGTTAEERLRESDAGCNAGRELVAAVRLGGGNGTRIDSADDLARTLFDRWTATEADRRVMLTIGASRMGLGLYATDGGTAYATLDIC